MPEETNWRTELDDLIRHYGADHVGIMFSANIFGVSSVTLTVTRTVEIVNVFNGESMEANRLFNEIMTAINQAQHNFGN